MRQQKRFVLKAVRVFTFIVALFFASCAPALGQDVQALLAGEASATVLTELLGYGACLFTVLFVLVRLDGVLFEYVGAAGSARLVRAGATAAAVV